jgi:hypothetical protein
VIKRNTWIMLAVLAVVLAVAYVSQNQPQKASGAPTPTPGDVSFFTDVSEKSITTLRIEDASGKAVVLGRDAAGLWLVTQPKGGPTDVAQAETAVSQLLALQSISPLDPTSDPGIFGLGKPAYTLTLTLEGSQKYVLLIGDVTPLGNGYYVRLNQNAPDIVNKGSIDALLGLWSHPPFVATPTLASSAAPTPGTPAPGPASTQSSVPTASPAESQTLPAPTTTPGGTAAP